MWSRLRYIFYIEASITRIILVRVYKVLKKDKKLLEYKFYI